MIDWVNNNVILMSVLAFFIPLWIHTWKLHNIPLTPQPKFEDSEPDGLEGIKLPTNGTVPIYETVQLGMFHKRKIITRYRYFVDGVELPQPPSFRMVRG